MRTFLLLLLLAPLAVVAQNRPGDAILGEWRTEEGKAKVNIYRAANGKYYGTIMWLKNPHESDGTPRRDKENPDEKLRTRPIVGIEVLRDFSYDADDSEWNGGRIYDPESGSDYRCYLVLEGTGRLKLRGYIGFSLLGRTSYWTR